MSYLENRKTNNRAVTVIAVTAIEAMVIYGIVRGLDSGGFIKLPRDRVDSYNVPIPPPPPPPPTEDVVKHDPAKKSATAIETKPNALATTNTGPSPLPTDSPLGPEIAIFEKPQVNIPNPQPSFTPRSPVPRGKPGTWATPNDYPARDLREGNYGVAKFRLSIGADGRVEDCAIIASSGHPSLDVATCAKVSARARFDPATDSSGTKVSGTYVNSIRWEIPE